MKPISRLQEQYHRLEQKLARIGPISQGSVLERPPAQQGSRFVWTRKVRGKTVTVALSKKQYIWLKKAVINQRELEQIVGKMQILSRQILFATFPDDRPRKRLDKKLLGLI